VFIFARVKGRLGRHDHNGDAHDLTGYLDHDH
jgi:hypothetical protein